MSASERCAHRLPFVLNASLPTRCNTPCRCQETWAAAAQPSNELEIDKVRLSNHNKRLKRNETMPLSFISFCAIPSMYVAKLGRLLMHAARTGPGFIVSVAFCAARLGRDIGPIAHVYDKIRSTAHARGMKWTMNRCVQGFGGGQPLRHTAGAHQQQRALLSHSRAANPGRNVRGSTASFVPLR